MGLEKTSPDATGWLFWEKGCQLFRGHFGTTDAGAISQGEERTIRQFGGGDKGRQGISKGEERTVGQGLGEGNRAWGKGTGLGRKEAGLGKKEPSFGKKVAGLGERG